MRRLALSQPSRGETGCGPGMARSKRRGGYTESMSQERYGPGAALILLRRAPTSIDVMIESAPGAGMPFRVAPSRRDASQRELAEELVRESPVSAVNRLYATSLQVEGADGPLGVFVAFAGAAPGEASQGPWTDLRDAPAQLPPAWAAVLEGVRQQFVARSPDEALRVR